MATVSNSLKLFSKATLVLDTAKTMVQAWWLKSRIGAMMGNFQSKIQVDIPVALMAFLTKVNKLLETIMSTVKKLAVLVGNIKFGRDGSTAGSKALKASKGKAAVALDTDKTMTQATSLRSRISSTLGTFLSKIRINFPLNLLTFLLRVAKLVGPILNIFKVLSALKGVVGALLGGVAAGMKALLGGVVTGVKGLLGGALTGVKGLLGGAFAGVKSLFRGKGGMPAPAAGDKLAAAAPDGAAKAGSGILGLAKGAANFLISNGGKLAEKTIIPNMEQQDLLYMFQARTGNDKVGSAMFAKFKKEAIAAGADVNQSLKNTLSFLPVAQNTNHLSKMNTMAQRLNAFGGGEDFEGAASAVRDAVTGDTGALESDFHISKAAISQSKLEDLGKSGDVEGAMKALDQLMEKQNMGQAAYEKLMSSPMNQIQTMKNGIQSAMSDAGQGATAALMPLIQLLNTAFQSGKFQPYFDALSVGLRGAALIFKALVEAALAVSTAIQTHWPLISNILTAIAVAVIAGLVVSLWMAVPPLIAQAIAWLAINWPILLIMAAVGALVYILMQCGVTTEQVVGFIAGSFMVLIGVIWNVIAGISNGLVGFAEIMINAFFSVKNACYELALTWAQAAINMLRNAETFAGGFMKGIIGAINLALKGFNWLLDFLNSKFGTNLEPAKLFEEPNVHAISDSMQAMLDGMDKPMEQKVDFSGAKMGYKNLKNEFDYGYKGGTDFMKNLSFSMPSPDMSALDGWMNQNAIINRVNEVGSIDDTVDISSEDLKVMRDLAEMKSIQNFVSLTPTVQLTGDIHNNNTGDVEDMLGQIVEALQVEVSSSVSGVIA
ncbi:hypothetical protein [Paenibacillus whitsoniae]|uniref:Phage tail tape measure protein n=1 Tax=Paenibacillus whitsoniae TaxID=2496558 RepID=A0A430JE32_9BACL|nr:hypothetical protein [Paenibacillus whitsoniae]RTE09302.1 hypothetical protein EJQ19_13055 [Paenibacillus whitsoniae]